MLGIKKYRGRFEVAVCAQHSPPRNLAVCRCLYLLQVLRCATRHDGTCISCSCASMISWMVRPGKCFLKASGVAFLIISSDGYGNSDASTLFSAWRYTMK